MVLPPGEMFRPQWLPPGLQLSLCDSVCMTVAAHMRGMRPAPTSKKDTLMLREKLKH